MKILIKTLFDIGPFRIYRRILYEIRKFLENNSKIIVRVLNPNCFSKTPTWVLGKDFSNIDIPSRNLNLNNQNTIKFKFLNEEKDLNFPFQWSKKKWLKLWQFNLHYFEWSRQCIDEFLKYNNWPDNSYFIAHCIDDWIEKNPIGIGDGWHSYTTSLRIRNWVWIFRVSPKMKNKKRIDSLWKQINWLNNHLETHHGGNHLVENLCSLLIGSLQFEGTKASSIYNNSLRKLKLELSSQILSDGGHEERSAVYTLLILDRLIEVACILSLNNKGKPEWLLIIIKSMLEWASKVKIKGENLPNFNDSSINICPDINQVIFFGKNYLEKDICKSNGLRSQILELYLKELKTNKNIIHEKQFKTNKKIHRNSFITHLQATGWVILRPGHGWELAFKCGISCPKHLAAHAHSDMLSFDLWKNGKPFIISSGVSTYEAGKIRSHERSMAAHNCLQLGRLEKTKINWIESVDTWGSFRAGRKSNPKDWKQGKRLNWLWSSGSHDAFTSLNATHYRWIGVRFNKKDGFILVIVDSIQNEISLGCRSWIHFAPDFQNLIKSEDLKLSFYPNKYKRNLININSYYSKSMGKRFKRESIQFSNTFEKGIQRFITILSSKKIISNFKINNKRNEEIINFKDIGNISWEIDKINEIIIS